ncbi:MAG: biotin transporter BioY [Pseudomonadota bacterium]
MSDMVLSKALIGHDGIVKKAGLVLAGSVALAIVSQLSVGWPVPMSLQGLAILIIGFTFGSRLAAATVVAWLAYGAMGFPVFSNGQSLPALTGATAGFLYGFVAMAWLAGLAADRGWTKNMFATLIVGAIVSVLLYVPGLAWPAAFLGKTAPELWAGWMAPFLVGDMIKAVIAAMVVAGGWQLVKARKG